MDPDNTSPAPVARVRSHTVSIKRLGRRVLLQGASEYPPEINEAAPRPGTWGECQAVELGTSANPCPYVSCKYHLAFDIDPDTGSIKENFPGVEIDELIDTCVLAVAERGEQTLEEVGAALNITRERVRQIEARALLRVLPRAQARRLLDLAPDPPAEPALG